MMTTRQQQQRRDHPTILHALLAYHGQLPRHDLGLECRCELLRLVESQPEVRQAGLLATLNVRDLCLGRHAGLQLRHQLHPPHQFRHQPTLFPWGQNLADREPVPTILHALFCCLGPVNTTAGHAVAYPLGTRHHIAHGIACEVKGRTAPYPSRVAPLEPCLGAGCLVAHRPGFDPPRMERGRVACGVGIEVGSVLVRRARCFAQSNPGEAHRSGSSAARDDRNRRADPGARGRLPAGSQGQSPAGVGRSWLNRRLASRLPG